MTQQIRPSVNLAFELLSFFCRSASRVYSREQLLREVWGIRQARRAC
jgi:DNA-binding response OmpR family regulator